jgi:hypothetical protein
VTHQQPVPTTSPTPPRESRADRRLRERLLREGFLPGEIDEALAPRRSPGTPVPVATTGAATYALGFLAYLPVPVLGAVITGVAMALGHRVQRRRSPLAAENSRQAANWGLTVAVVAVGLVVLTWILVAILERGMAPAIPLIGLLPLGIAHLVVVITGLAKAQRHEVFHNRLAIPFFRP